MKKANFILPFAAGLAFALTGCTTMVESTDVPLATRADLEYLRGEVRTLRDRLASSEAELGRVQGEVASAQSSQPGYASAGQVQALQTQVEDLQRQLRALDAARVQDKKEIYDDISRKIATILKSAPAPSAARSAPSRPRSGSQSGIEHAVQPGESLSKIAAAYGVKMSEIVAENGLKNADSIYVGQKLFIPD